MPDEALPPKRPEKTLHSLELYVASDDKQTFNRVHGQFPVMQRVADTKSILSFLWPHPLKARQSHQRVAEHLPLEFVEHLHLPAGVVDFPVDPFYDRVVQAWKEVLCQLTMNVAPHWLGLGGLLDKVSG